MRTSESGSQGSAQDRERDGDSPGAGAAASAHERPPRFAVGTRENLAVAPARAADSTGPDDVECIVHDLKSPLSAVVLATDALESATSAEQSQMALAVIRRNLVFMDGLIHTLLDTTRGTGRSREHVELAGLVECVVARCVAPQRDRVVLQLHGTAVVHVEVAEVERVLENLLHNALVYAPASTPIVIRLERRTNVVRLSVIDQGPGLDLAQQRRAFAKYERGGAGSGHGLGLYLCRTIIARHGGRIGVESGARGARFFFELPIVPAERPRGSALDGKHVLVIDPELERRRELADTLRARGAQATPVGSCAEALARAATHKPDVVLLALQPRTRRVASLTLVALIRELVADVPCFVLADRSQLQLARTTVGGATDVHVLEVSRARDEVAAAIERVLERSPELR